MSGSVEERSRACGREHIRDLGRMPKKTRAAASNAVAAEVDSGDESALAPKRRETFEAELDRQCDGTEHGAE